MKRFKEMTIKQCWNIRQQVKAMNINLYGKDMPGHRTVIDDVLFEKSLSGRWHLKCRLKEGGGNNLPKTNNPKTETY